MTTVLITSRSFGGGERDLIADITQAGHTVVRGPAHHDLDELRDTLASVNGWIAGTGAITRDHLDAAPHLAIIARYGVGTDAVDLSAASERGVVVTNTPGANSDAVADLALALILDALRHITTGNAQVRGGNWSALPGAELGAASVGVIGFGRIGKAVTRRLGGFGSRVLAFDPFVDEATCATAGATKSTLENIFTEADVITLHSPGGDVIISSESLARVKPHSVIVNTARADLVDESALALALREGRLGHYASDVLNGDTSGSPSPLLAEHLSHKVTVTPHIAAQTFHAIDRMGSMAWANVQSVLRGDKPLNPVHPTR